jgi:hypothetical protein
MELTGSPKKPTMGKNSVELAKERWALVPVIKIKMDSVPKSQKAKKNKQSNSQTQQDRAAISL